MASEVVIQDIEGVTQVTLNSGVAVKRGDLLGYSSGWVKADADAASYVYAQYIALEIGGGGENVAVCRRGTLYDADAPFTANTPYYLSGTAGTVTSTRPATDGDMIQVVGRALDTSRLRVEIVAPVEWELFIPANGVFDATGEAGIGTEDTGWYGPQVDAAAEVVGIVGRFPSGLISLDVARAVYNSINASALDMDVSVVRAYDGAANNQDTGTAITAGDWNEDADDKLLYQDVSACFDSDFVKPNCCFAVKFDPDAITNDAQLLGVYLRGWKV